MSIFDAVIIGITLILAIKGFFNGFIKEIAGLVGIVGGLILASKFYHQVGVYINQNLFAIPNKSAIDLVGFIAVFVGFWLFAVFVGFLLAKILKLSALGVFDRILGFVFSGAKFFVLIAVIIALLYQVKFVREKMHEYTQKSLVYPVLLKVGEKIINISPQDLEKVSKNVKIPIK
ncbi:CvpA family protein [Caminibacter pacificus]|uniref:CvpA family protein n=1 Tax=Caminibacter pacificus TaxID=1424653 RepID=A0AAJ4UYE3_9BACT|nr:CvpA family protein [Caminibacter pacificus]NPA87414.1 CvpA family protein [Campylobacterota bacterium]QCI28424.1 CvpA family protein [Caminibacter pacificus]ROR40851.1 membrane protein required for colicin V production [Caminibacter pacificus]